MKWQYDHFWVLKENSALDVHWSCLKCRGTRKLAPLQHDKCEVSDEEYERLIIIRDIIE